MKRNSLILELLALVPLTSCFYPASNSIGTSSNHNDYSSQEYISSTAIDSGQESSNSFSSSSSQISQTVIAAVLKTSGDESEKLTKGYVSATTERPASVDIATTDSEIGPVRFFGAALTHSSAYVLMNLNEARRTEILKKLFTSTGANLNVIRIPIGASDFIPGDSFFSCADKEGPDSDPLANFNIDNDDQIIEVAKEMETLKPDLKIIATAWSAPAWMKTSDTLLGGSLKSGYEEVYAKYIDDFVSAYAKEGITVDFVTPGNEPQNSTSNYPSMTLSSQQEATIARDLSSLLPEDTKTLAYDHNCDNAISYVEGIEEDDGLSLFSGIAIHGYSGGINDTIPSLVSKFGKEVYLTELTEYEYEGQSFSGDLLWSAENATVYPYSLGLSGTLYWNLALYPDGTPNKGQVSICYGVVTVDDKDDQDSSYTFNPAYYSMAQVANMLDISDKNGVMSLETTTSLSGIKAASFLSDDGTYEVVVINDGAEKDDVSIGIGSYYLKYDLAPDSITSLALKEGGDG